MRSASPAADADNFHLWCKQVIRFLQSASTGETLTFCVTPLAAAAFKFRLRLAPYIQPGSDEA